LDSETLRRLVKHTSGFICEGISSNCETVTEGERTASNIGGAIQWAGDLDGWNKVVKGGNRCMQVLFFLIKFIYCCCHQPQDIELQLSLAFQYRVTPATLQGGSRPEVSYWGCIIGPSYSYASLFLNRITAIQSNNSFL
jgi:hypothetical protein